MCIRDRYCDCLGERVGGSVRACPPVAFLALGAPSGRLVLLKSPKMSDVPDCGSVAKFAPTVRGVDVTTCGWPVVIGFMCAIATLRCAGMCWVCGLANVGWRCCSCPAMMGFPVSVGTL